VGRCTYGGIIDREIRDLIPVDPVIPNRPLSLAEDLGRAFDPAHLGDFVTA
jgi:hypothetical protein